MPLVDVSGAFDLHIHSTPSLFHRSGTDIDMARHAAESGLAGILLKNHFESTAGRARLTEQQVPGIRVFGSLVLNHFAGGLNPFVVETALGLGARQIYMPTLDAQAHWAVFGPGKSFNRQTAETHLLRQSIRILDETGALRPEVKVIVDLVREAGALLGTAHLSRDEIFVLAAFCREIKFDGLLITHPYFNPPRLSVPDQVELVRMGAFLELCGGNLYPIPGVANLDNYLETIAAVGEQSLILSSDAGQPRKSLPAEVLRVFAQCLMEKGITQEKIDRMTKDNPAWLLRL